MRACVWDGSPPVWDGSRVCVRTRSCLCMCACACPVAWVGRWVPCRIFSSRPSGTLQRVRLPSAHPCPSLYARDLAQKASKSRGSKSPRSSSNRTAASSCAAGTTSMAPAPVAHGGTRSVLRYTRSRRPIHSLARSASARRCSVRSLA